MPVEDDGDRAGLLADFGEEVVLRPAESPSAAIVAIWDQAAALDALDLGRAQGGFDLGDVPVQRAPAAFVARSSDLAGLAQGDAVRRTADGSLWTVAAVLPDGTGMSRAELLAA